MKRFLMQVGPWSDAIPSVTLAGYAVPIRRAAEEPLNPEP